jgi:hypothetical protein
MNLGRLPPALRGAFAPLLSAADVERIRDEAQRATVAAAIIARLRASYDRAPPTRGAVRAALANPRRPLPYAADMFLSDAAANWQPVLTPARPIELRLDRAENPSPAHYVPPLTVLVIVGGGVFRGVWIDMREGRNGFPVDATELAEFALLRRRYALEPIEPGALRLGSELDMHRQATLLAALFVLFGDAVAVTGGFYGAARAAATLAVLRAVRASVAPDAVVRLRVPGDLERWRQAIQPALRVALVARA